MSLDKTRGNITVEELLVINKYLQAELKAIEKRLNIKDEALDISIKKVISLHKRLLIAVEALNELGHVGVELENGQPYECNVAQVAQEALEKIKELEK